MATRKNKKKKQSVPAVLFCVLVCVFVALYLLSSEDVADVEGTQTETVSSNTTESSTTMTSTTATANSTATAGSTAAANSTANSTTTVSATATDGIRYEIAEVKGERAQQIIEHLAYRVSYNADWHLPNWVAYELTADELVGDLSRTDKFLPDPLVEGDPVVTKDYSGSGYDRGHMAPAADMRWSEQAMAESFYMTNMCPQNHNNNAGDWKDLENLVRDIAATYGNVYVCAGPIVREGYTTIGTARKIVVPQAFYKVLLRRKTDGTWTAIGFVMPNEAGNKPLMSYMVSVDEAEAQSGVDFFVNLPDSIEDAVEADYTVKDWETSHSANLGTD